MRFTPYFLFINLIFIVLLTGCKKEEKSILSPTTINSLAPNLFKDSADNLYISWMETPEEKKTELYFAKWENEKWGARQKIGEGDNWFVNWADFPSVTIHNEDANHWMAHWLQYTAEGTYDYEVRIAQSFDAGHTWQPSLVPHRDSVAAEHGFVSILPAASGSFRAVWLDGRYTKTASSENHDHSSGGPMTLRTALINRKGNISSSRELDSRVCDCCQTGMANVAGGPMVVYRDRSSDEIRDISFVRAVGNQWTLPQTLHPDNWKIAGCPVNGPVIRSKDNIAAVAWYTNAENNNGSGVRSSVKLMISENGGITFEEPRGINIYETAGRVDLVIDKGNIFISWIESNDNEVTELLIQKINIKTSTAQIIHRQGISPQRASGFPRLAVLESGDLMLAWTEVLEEETFVKTRLVESLRRLPAG